MTPRHLFFARASGLAVSLSSVTDVTSPQGEFTSPTFGRSHSHRTDGDDSTAFFARASGGLLVSVAVYFRQDAQRVFR